jgi:putative oxidoreductase
MSSNSLDSGSPAANNALMMLIARIMMAHIFIVAGIRKAMTYEGTMKYISTQLPMADILTPLTIVFEIGAGALLVLGWRTRQVALLMGLFCLVSGYFFHAFWAVPEAAFQGQMNNFMKNIAMAGGFLMITMFGPGSMSVDKR